MTELSAAAMMAGVPDLRTVQIACDESGSEGENLIEGSSRVFAHGSTDLDPDAASQLINKLREAVKFKGPELKSMALLPNTSRWSVLLNTFAPGGPLSGRAKFLVIDKWYMAAAKVIDLVIEEDAYANGIDIYGTGEAYRMAQTLIQEGPRAFGDRRLQKLLGDFVSFVRLKQRVGAKTTEAELLQTIDDLRLRNNRRSVTAIMQRLWQGRHYLAGYGPDAPATTMGTLEPIVPAIVSTAKDWHQVHRIPVEIVHDRQAALTPAAVKDILAISSVRFPNIGIPPPIASLQQVDSRTDARVQVADLVAGVGAWAARSALDGTLPRQTAELIRPYMMADSMWADVPSWIRLYGRTLR
ncbi:DUF3800 domain-containing protein [Mycolicibacterium fortuitum]|uniref:DUF3800 domain-containing protein n=1 Tax=Mycolicibacterium fortuitum TaxID=1766 RepID=UPI001CE222D9|nr:DUF3800 domain-containing protein [Mycolicibacterium fortuitum]MCA4727107.1 DUF3800 domain-containing protein [Mycolicibacterium fortuitum]